MAEVIKEEGRGKDAKRLAHVGNNVERNDGQIDLTLASSIQERTVGIAELSRRNELQLRDVSVRDTLGEEFEGSLLKRRLVEGVSDAEDRRARRRGGRGFLRDQRARNQAAQDRDERLKSREHRSQ
jgi:hypothetical protein